MEPTLRAPTKVVGRYALYGEIAAGGMATVHIGRLLGPVGFARTVAVKRLHPQFAKDPEFVAMFLDEARVAARVQHPNVVATIDVVAADGELFLIMDYVRGESLSRLVRAATKRGEHVPSLVCSSVMCGFLHGLHAAHEAKSELGEPLRLVHRDVSPQNVLVGTDGVARALDFGIAKAAGRAQVTREGQIKGKLAYMAPEQLRGLPLTRSTDIYASGVVLWEALTGDRLFKGETESETLARMVKGDVPPPSHLVPGLSEEYDRVVLRAVSRDPAARFATAREMALALERCEGIASPTDVGEWVELVAGEAIQSRESRVAEMESASASLKFTPSGRFTVEEPSDSDVSAPIPPGGLSPPSGSKARPVQEEGTLIGIGPASGGVAASAGAPVGRAPAADVPASEVTSSTEPSRVRPVPRMNGLKFAAIGGAVLVAVGLLVVIVAAIRPGPTASGLGAPPPSTSERPPPSSMTASVPSVPSVPSVSSVIAEPLATGVDSTAAATSSAIKPPTTKPSAKPGGTPPTTPPPKPKNCDPPFTVDAKGHRHYKVECM